MKLYCPECKETFDDVTLTSCPHDDARLFALENEEADPLLGAVIDQRFRIEAKLGQGGMGAVYTATQLSVGRKVAVKVLKKELIDREVALERFYRESKLTSELSHPNIVKLIDFGQDRERDLLYLVMELVSGVNMGDLLEQGRMRVPLALEIVYQACGALTEPHAQGIIHRDLKPDNMLIVPVSDGTIQVKVLDFGIARALEANTQLTATGMVCGTPAYMAPEQAQNQEIGPRTDLYALGVILYEMLCGVPPFQGQNSLQIMLQHIQMAPTPLSDYIPPSTLPDEVEELVHDMLSKTPEGRPASAIAVRTSIEKIRRLYNLDPVRIDPGTPHTHLFDDFILARLPGFSGNGRSQTEALRRETNMERQLGASSYSTDERHQIAHAETSLEASPEPELVTVPAQTALDRQLAQDAQHHADRLAPPSPLLPVRRPDAQQVPTPESGKPQPRSNYGSTATRPTTPPPSGGLGIKVLAAGIGLMIVVAVLALVAIVASSPPDATEHDTPQPMTVKATEEPLTPSKKEPEAKQPPGNLLVAPSTLDEAANTTKDHTTPPEKDTPPATEEKKAPEKAATSTPEPTKTTKTAKKTSTTKTKKTKTVKKTTPPQDTKEPVAAPIKKEPVKTTVKKDPPKVEKKKSLGNLFGGAKPAKKKDSSTAKDHFNKP